MNEPRIALVTLDYPPEHGGVARYLGNLVEVSEGGIEVFVPETHVCEGPGRVKTMRMFAPGPWSWRRLVASCYALRTQGFTHVFVSHVLPVGTAAWIAHLFGGLSYSVLVHGLDIRLAAQRPHRRWLAGQVLRRAAHVFTNSQVVANEVHRFWPAIKVEVMTPGVEPRAFLSREEARAQLGVERSARICLTVARLVPRKGIDMMIRVLEHHPDWRYVVVGSGGDEARLRDLADMHAPGRVEFVTHATDHVRDLWYAAADMFVFFAREAEADIEGFGIVPLEAGLAGLPVLAGRAGGVIEAVVDGVTGVLVDPRDLAAMSAAFGALANDPTQREALGRAGSARVQKDFAWRPRWERLRAILKTP